jgi:hypothetical protein
LVATLVRTDDGRPNLLTLSRSGGSPGNQSLAITVAEILLDNSSVALGETTGLQTLARPTPGEEASPIDHLRQYMTKIASVSG